MMRLKWVRIEPQGSSKILVTWEEHAPGEGRMTHGQTFASMDEGFKFAWDLYSRHLAETQASRVTSKMSREEKREAHARANDARLRAWGLPVDSVAGGLAAASPGEARRDIAAGRQPAGDPGVLEEGASRQKAT